MATGIAIGGLAQGLASGLQSGFGIGRAVREKERFELERPALEAAAEKGKQELTFQKDYAEKLKGLYEEAKGGEVQGEDGTVVQKPPMSPVEMELRSADLMKQSMVAAGLMDFKRLAEARQYSKMIEEEGVMAAMDYAIKNPNDQEGIRKMFNQSGKVKMGDDITIGIENGQFGSKVVGTRVGANGKVEKVFDGADLLRPYISAGTYAQMQNQKDIAAGKEEGDTARAGIAANATMESARLREKAADQRSQNQLNTEGARAAALERKNDLSAIYSGVTSDIQAALRNTTNSIDSDRTIMIGREASALAERLYLSDPNYRGKPGQARADATAATLKKYKINIAPTFPRLNRN